MTQKTTTTTKSKTTKGKASTKKAPAKKTATAKNKTKATPKKKTPTKDTSQAKKTATKRSPAKKVPAKKTTTAKNKTKASPKKKPVRKNRTLAQKKVDLEKLTIGLTPQLKDLVSKGYKQGTLEAEEIAEALTVLEADDSVAEELYEILKKADIETVDEAIDEAEKEETIVELTDNERYTTDSFRQYLHDIRPIKLLTKEQEVELAQKKGPYVELKAKKTEGTIDKAEFEEAIKTNKTIAESKAAYDLMWNSNLRLVISIAKGFNKKGLDFLDICQEGNIGLSRAIDKFDWERGHKLSTYATWWIRQQISRSIADQAKTIRIPVHVVDRLNTFRRERSALASKLGREPTNKEIADQLGVEEDVIENYKILDNDPISLNAQLGDDEDGAERQDMISDDEAAQPEDNIMSDAIGQALDRALDELTDIERQVICLRLGLADEPERTLEDVSAKIGPTRERIRMIERSALEKLRKNKELGELLKMM